MMQFLNSNLLYTKNTYKNLKFYSTSLNPLPINSTPDNIVFDQNKAGLLLPSIGLITFVGDEIDSDFIYDLRLVLENLEQGSYKFDFYVYIETDEKLNLYNLNTAWDCLYNDLDTKGYIDLATKHIDLGFKPLKSNHLMRIVSELESDLSTIVDDNITHNFDKDIVLIITKTN